MIRKKRARIKDVMGKQGGLWFQNKGQESFFVKEEDVERFIFAIENSCFFNFIKK